MSKIVLMGAHPKTPSILENLLPELLLLVFIFVDKPRPFSRASRRIHEICSDPVHQLNWLAARYPPSHLLYYAVYQRLWTQRHFEVLLSNGAVLSKQLIQMVSEAITGEHFGGRWGAEMPLPSFAYILLKGSEQYGSRLSLIPSQSDRQKYGRWYMGDLALEDVKDDLTEGKFVPFEARHLNREYQYEVAILGAVMKDVRCLPAFLQNGFRLSMHFVDSLTAMFLRQGGSVSLYQMQDEQLRTGAWRKKLLGVSRSVAIEVTQGSILGWDPQGSKVPDELSELRAKRYLDFDLNEALALALQGVQSTERWNARRGILGMAGVIVKYIERFPGCLGTSSAWAAPPVLLYWGSDQAPNAFAVAQKLRSAHALLQGIDCLSAAHIHRILSRAEVNREFVIAYAEKYVAGFSATTDEA